MITAESSTRPARTLPKPTCFALSQPPARSRYRDLLETAIAAVCDCHRLGGSVLLCGNGGSAADCGHIAAELGKGFLSQRKPSPRDSKILRTAFGSLPAKFAGLFQQGVRAINLCEQSALNSAICNDLHPDLVFAQQVYVHSNARNLLIALSTSGNSKNVISALKVARAFGLKAIGFTGKAPCAMDVLCDTIFKVPENDTYRVQECHLPLYHALCAGVERELFGE